MEKEEILDTLNKNLSKNKVNIVMDTEMMDKLVIDVSRVADSKITCIINEIKNEKDLKLTSFQKEAVRKKIIGYPVKLPFQIGNYSNPFTNQDYESAYKLVSNGFKRHYNVMMDSLTARIKKNFLAQENHMTERYIDYIHSLQVNKKQLLILNVSADDELSTDYIAQIISEKYDELSNYHHMIINFIDGEKQHSWKSIAEIGIFMEHFRTEKNFTVFNKRGRKKRINELITFLKENKNISLNDNIRKIVESFYDGVFYGFQFEDLFISSDGHRKTLVMQKVELDEEPKLCPACMKDIVRGNSYPRVLYKSFECQNPSCPSRSKSGRGKRYDLYSSKRQMMLERNSHLDHIEDGVYKAFRRDIINNDDMTVDNLIMLYSWAGDSVEIINGEVSNGVYKGRTISTSDLPEYKANTLIEDLKIIKLFKQILSSIVFTKGDSFVEKEIIDKQTIINGNSTELMPFIDSISDIKSFAGAITSPPYYNAREYSQWPNLLCYLIDMMINAKAVYERMEADGTYIYNIGDVVGKDNIHIRSNMSNRRQMLGFYSVMIFELAGFHTAGNIIWDKGEVQSKRNSTPNHISGYVKPVNAYEHCFVFKKKKVELNTNTVVKRIDTVKKINSKGVNTYGHTAPYPLEIAKLIIPFVEKDGLVVDPFLGSGTTLLAMDEEGYKGLGFELNNDYYNLSLNRLLANNTLEGL